MSEENNEEGSEQKVVRVTLHDLMNKEFKFKTGEDIKIVIEKDSFEYSK